jgi:hypothetical protein
MYHCSSLLERNTDDVIKASKNGDFVMVSGKWQKPIKGKTFLFV